MRRRSFQPGVWVAVLVLLASCQASPPPLDGQITIPVARLSQTTVATVDGVVWAPTGYSADSAAAEHVLNISDAPLAGASVFLATPDRKPFTGILPTRTDSQGRFTFTGVPPGLRLLVMARVKDRSGKAAVLMALVQTRNGELRQDLNVASTLVSGALLNGNADLSHFSQESFQAAVETLGKALTAQTLPDLTSADAIAAGAQSLIDASCATKVPFDALKTGTTEACSPTPAPHSGGGGFGGGGAPPPARPPAPAPSTGSFTAQIQIQDGPVLPATPSPTPTPVPSPTGT